MEGPFEIVSLNAETTKILGDPGVTMYLQAQHEQAWEFELDEADALDLARRILCSVADDTISDRKPLLVDACKCVSAYLQVDCAPGSDLDSVPGSDPT